MRYGILGLLCVVAAIAYLQRAAISVPAKEVAADLGLQEFAGPMGIVLSMFYLGYGLFQLPGGWLADRLGSRAVIAGMCLLWSALTMATGLATGLNSLIALWFTMGAAQAAVFPCATKMIGEIFPQEERARASGILGCGMALGGTIAPWLAGLSLKGLTSMAGDLHVDRWRLLLGLFGVPGIVWAVLFLLTVPRSALPAAASARSARQVTDWTRLVRSLPLLLLCAQQFFRAAAMVFFLTWFPTFLQEARGVTVEESGRLTSIAGIGGIIGTLLGGFASDKLLQITGNRRLARQGIAVAGMALCAVLILLSYFVADTGKSIGLISLATFCATFGGVSGYTVAIDFGGRHVATVFSTMNMCGNFGAMLFPLVAGPLVDRTGSWNVMLFLFAGIMAVDAVCWLVLNPQGTLFGDAEPGATDAAS